MNVSMIRSRVSVIVEVGAKEILLSRGFDILMMRLIFTNAAF